MDRFVSCLYIYILVSIYDTYVHKNNYIYVLYLYVILYVQIITVHICNYIYPYIKHYTIKLYIYIYKTYCIYIYTMLYLIYIHFFLCGTNYIYIHCEPRLKSIPIHDTEGKIVDVFHLHWLLQSKHWSVTVFQLERRLRMIMWGQWLQILFLCGTKSCRRSSMIFGM